MFGLSKGEKKFNRCALRELENGYDEEQETYWSTLRCPQLGPGRTRTSSGYETYAGSLRGLALNAGRTACAGCRLVDMDEVDAYKYAAERDTARAEALRAGAERQQAEHEAQQVDEAIRRFASGEGQGPVL